MEMWVRHHMAGEENAIMSGMYVGYRLSLASDFTDRELDRCPDEIECLQM